MDKRIIVIYQIFLFIFLNLIDAIQTLILTYDGLAIELNPIPAYLLELGPIKYFLTIKIISSIAYSILFYAWYPKLENIINMVLIIYSIVVIYHTMIIVSLKF